MTAPGKDHTATGWTIVIGAVVLGIVVAMKNSGTGSADQPADRTVLTAADLGEAWPLNAESVTVGCDGWRDAWGMVPGGKKFGLNGKGMRAFGALEDTGLWKIDEKATTIYETEIMIPISPLTKAAIAHCEFSKQD